MKRTAFVMWMVLAVFVAAKTQDKSTNAVPTIAAKTAGMEKFTGFFNYYCDSHAGKLWL